jgi:hypothetical protein
MLTCDGPRCRQRREVAAAGPSDVPERAPDEWATLDLGLAGEAPLHFCGLGCLARWVQATAAQRLAGQVAASADSGHGPALPAVSEPQGRPTARVRSVRPRGARGGPTPPPPWGAGGGG